LESSKRISKKKRNRDENFVNEIHHVLEMDKLHQIINPPSELVKGVARKNVSQNRIFIYNFRW
jgi:hypothetical protein